MPEYFCHGTSGLTAPTESYLRYRLPDHFGQRLSAVIPTDVALQVAQDDLKSIHRTLDTERDKNSGYLGLMRSVSPSNYFGLWSPHSYPAIEGRSRRFAETYQVQEKRFQEIMGLAARDKDLLIECEQTPPTDFSDLLSRTVSILQNLATSLFTADQILLMAVSPLLGSWLTRIPCVARFGATLFLGSRAAPWGTAVSALRFILPGMTVFRRATPFGIRWPRFTSLLNFLVEIPKFAVASYVSEKYGGAWGQKAVMIASILFPGLGHGMRRGIQQTLWRSFQGGTLHQELRDGLLQPLVRYAGLESSRTRTLLGDEIVAAGLRNEKGWKVKAWRRECDDTLDDLITLKGSKPLQGLEIDQSLRPFDRFSELSEPEILGLIPEKIRVYFADARVLTHVGSEGQKLILLGHTQVAGHWREFFQLEMRARAFDKVTDRWLAIDYIRLQDPTKIQRGLRFNQVFPSLPGELDAFGGTMRGIQRLAEAFRATEVTADPVGFYNAYLLRRYGFRIDSRTFPLGSQVMEECVAQFKAGIRGLSGGQRREFVRRFTARASGQTGDDLIQLSDGGETIFAICR